MKKLTTFLLLSTFMTFSILAMNGPVLAKTIELKFGHVGAPGSLFLACADEFAKRANAKLGDKAKVVTFGSSQLGKDKELLKKVKHYSEIAGYSSVDEFITHALEREIERLEESDSEEEIKKKLQGLGYIS